MSSPIESITIGLSFIISGCLGAQGGKIGVGLGLGNLQGYQESNRWAFCLMVKRQARGWTR